MVLQVKLQKTEEVTYSEQNKRKSEVPRDFLEVFR